MVPTALQPSTWTVENRRVLAVRGRAPHPALHAELGTRPPVTLVYQVLRKNNRASNQLAECPASTSRPRAAVTVGSDSPPGSPEPPAQEGPPTEAAAGAPRPHARQDAGRAEIYLQVLGVSFLGKGLVLAGAPSVRDLLQLPEPKTPSKLRKSQVQTNKYKAGGREENQPQAFLK